MYKLPYFKIELYLSSGVVVGVVVVVLPLHDVEVDEPIVLVPLPCLRVVVLTQGIESVVQHVVVVAISEQVNE